MPTVRQITTRRSSSVTSSSSPAPVGATGAPRITLSATLPSATRDQPPRPSPTPIVLGLLADDVLQAALKRAFHRIRKDAAVGVDGITKEQYGQQLEENLRGLHERLRTMRYRHQPIQRVHIPKANGKARPIGVSSLEDKIVQGALRPVGPPACGGSRLTWKRFDAYLEAHPLPPPRICVTIRAQAA